MKPVAAKADTPFLDRGPEEEACTAERARRGVLLTQCEPLGIAGAEGPEAPLGFFRSQRSPVFIGSAMS